MINILFDYYNQYYVNSWGYAKPTT